MSILSDAVSLDRISRIVGYKITKGNFAESTPNLPQRIAVLAEANTDKQSSLPSVPFQPLNLQDVADKFGYGSPAYLAMRILRPITGGGVGQPIVFYPVAEPAAGVAGVSTITVSGTATKIASHKVYVAGRNNVDGQSFEISIAVGDTATVVAGKIIAAVNKVYGSPVTATGSTADAVLTTKWKSVSAALKVRVSTEGDSAGLTYSIVTTVGTGAPVLTNALASFENDWNTIVINPYGADSTVLDTLQTFNGRPDPINPTGRYQGIIFKPFVALFSKSTNDPVTDVVVSGRSLDCTNVYCPAPNCDLFPVEVAANVAAILAPIMQNSPHVDVNGQSYPDAVLNESVSGGIGKYASYDYRDQAVKAGLSTVDYIGGGFQIQDLVTTYNPAGEITPQFRYVRNLVGIDWNVRYAYLLLENAFVVNKTLIPDGQIVGASNTIKPSEWKAILYGMFDDLANRGIIADAQFSKDSLQVQISSSNPDRFETFFRYKRTGIARICSTTAEAGFYYGS